MRIDTIAGRAIAISIIGMTTGLLPLAAVVVAGIAAVVWVVVR